MSENKDKRGRPTIPPDARRVNIIRVRMRDSLKESLETVAREEGVPLSSAIETVLERFFWQERFYSNNYPVRMMAHLLGAAFTMGGTSASIGKSLGAMTEDGDPDNWMADPYYYEMACYEVIEVLARYRPAGVIEGPDTAKLSDRLRGRILGKLRDYLEKRKAATDEAPKPPNIETEGLSSEDVMSTVGTFIALEDRRREIRKMVTDFLRESEAALENIRKQQTDDLDSDAIATVEWAADGLSRNISEARSILHGETPEDEDEDTIAVPRSMLGQGQHYALDVVGDAMIGDGIIEGDTVLVERADTATDGEIVVVLIDRERVQMARIVRGDGTVTLKTSNPEYPPATFEADRVKIEGRVVGLLRKYQTEPSLRTYQANTANDEPDEPRPALPRDSEIEEAEQTALSQGLMSYDEYAEHLDRVDDDTRDVPTWARWRSRLKRKYLAYAMQKREDKVDL